MIKQTKRLFSAEFKLEAAQLVINKNYSVLISDNKCDTHGKA
ncbi:transposase [Photobacterium damselae subsp. damselae]|nr:transposase [Photobacterium damselae subsp. damselae]TLS74025.1 transposase [Photobacterium damselae subsp. damselae]